MENNLASLSQLLSPLSTKHFYQQYWQTQPLLIKGDSTKLDNLFNKRSLEAAYEKAKDIKVFYDVDEVETKTFPIDAEHVQFIYNLGMTIILRNIEVSFPHLMTLIHSVKAELSLTEAYSVNIKGFYSKNPSAFGTHFDYQEVFVLQIFGKKEWYYSKEPVKEVKSLLQENTHSINMQSVILPITSQQIKLTHNVTCSYPNKKDFNRVIITQGDILYLPAGTWHKASACEDSLHLTLTVNYRKTNPESSIIQAIWHGNTL